MTTMNDPTEEIRRVLIPIINHQVRSDDPESERKRLVEEYGRVWDPAELSQDFHVKGFLAPFVIVMEKTTGKTGSLLFQHTPRFYFQFEEDK
jgi:hypothetical protein